MCHYTIISENLKILENEAGLSWWFTFSNMIFFSWLKTLLAPSTKFKVVPELERCTSVNVGCPIVLHCEVSDPTAQVSWYKNVTELLSKPGQDIQSEGTTRQLIIQSAELSHTGLYSCETMADAVQFIVNVKGDLQLCSSYIHTLTCSFLWKKQCANTSVLTLSN